MWIPLETNLGLGSFLVKLQTSSNSRSSKVYDALNSCCCFVMPFDALRKVKGRDSTIFFCLICYASMLFALWNPL